MTYYKWTLGAAVILAAAALGGCGNDSSTPSGSPADADAFCDAGGACGTGSARDS